MLGYYGLQLWASLNWARGELHGGIGHRFGLRIWSVSGFFPNGEDFFAKGKASRNGYKDLVEEIKAVSGWNISWSFGICFGFVRELKYLWWELLTTTKYA